MLDWPEIRTWIGTWTYRNEPEIGTSYIQLKRAKSDFVSYCISDWLSTYRYIWTFVRPRPSPCLCLFSCSCNLNMSMNTDVNMDMGMNDMDTWKKNCWFYTGWPDIELANIGIDFKGTGARDWNKLRVMLLNRSVDLCQERSRWGFFKFSCTF